MKKRISRRQKPIYRLYFAASFEKEKKTSNIQGTVSVLKKDLLSQIIQHESDGNGRRREGKGEKKGKRK